MQWEKYESLVRRLEGLARQDRQAYMRKVFMLSLVGYAYVLLVFFLTLALMSVLIWFIHNAKSLNWIAFMIAGLAFMSWNIVKALILPNRPPSGIEVTEQDAPRLIIAVNQLCRKLKTSPVHKIVIDGELNAAMAQVPLIGSFMYKNYLILGLPYMMAASAEQFTATVAHELGHMSRAHGRLGHWIYRAEATWYKILTSLEESGSLSAIIFTAFFIKYAPYFTAYAFVARRMHEYEADALAAEVAGAQSNAEDLLNLEVRGQLFVNEFWKEIYKRAENSPEPAFPYSEMAEFFRKPPNATKAKKIITGALKRRPGNYDTHPTLAQRLKALKVKPHLPPEMKKTAADVLLGRGLTSKLVEQIDVIWRDSIRAEWKMQGGIIRQRRRRMEELHRKAKTNRSSVRSDEMLELAELTEDMKDKKSAAPIYRAAIKMNPKVALAHYDYGVLLAEAGKESCIKHLEAAAKLDITSAAQSMEIIHDYYMKQGNKDEANKYYRLMMQRSEFLEKLEDEMSVLDLTEVLEKPTLDGAIVESLKSQFVQYDWIQSAYIGEIKHPIKISHPIYAVCIDVDPEAGVSDDGGLMDPPTIYSPLSVRPILLNVYSSGQKRKIARRSIKIV